MQLPNLKEARKRTKTEVEIIRYNKEDKYKNIVSIVGDRKPICFHECGKIPTVEQLKTTNTDWVWFMTWHTEYITDHNDKSDLKKIYNQKDYQQIL